jgi:hypothetical protein
MRIQEKIVKFVVNPVFYMLWHAVYTLAILLLFVARIRLAIKELCEIPVRSQTVGGLTVSQNLMGTPLP